VTVLFSNPPQTWSLQLRLLQGLGLCRFGSQHRKPGELIQSYRRLNQGDSGLDVAEMERLLNAVVQPHPNPICLLPKLLWRPVAANGSFPSPMQCLSQSVSAQQQRRTRPKPQIRAGGSEMPTKKSVSGEKTVPMIGRAAMAKATVKRLNRLADGIRLIHSRLQALKTDPATRPDFLKISEEEALLTERNNLMDPGFKGDYLTWFLEDHFQIIDGLAQFGRLSQKSNSTLRMLEDLVVSLLEDSNSNLVKTNAVSRLLQQWSEGLESMLMQRRFRDRSDFELSSQKSDYRDFDAAATGVSTQSAFRMAEVDLAEIASDPEALIADFELLNRAVMSFQVTEELSDCLRTAAESFPAGVVLILGGNDGAEALDVASFNKASFERVVSIELSLIGTIRTRRLYERMKEILPLTPIEAIQGNVMDYPYPINEASLVLVRNVVQHLSPPDRRRLYESLKKTVKAEGKILFEALLAEGSRYESRFFSKVRPRTVKVKHRLPGGRVYKREQHFFARGELEQELNEAGISEQNGFHLQITEDSKDNSAGFRRVQIVVTRKAEGRVQP
jgi:hypothetical protein